MTPHTTHFVNKSLPQWLHLNPSSGWCVSITWRLRREVSRNLLLQLLTGQAWGFSLVWLNPCCSKVHCLLKDLPQISQENGLQQLAAWSVGLRQCRHTSKPGLKSLSEAILCCNFDLLYSRPKLVLKRSFLDVLLFQTYFADLFQPKPRNLSCSVAFQNVY